MPAQFGLSKLYVDPPKDFMHYCFAEIQNGTNAKLGNVGALLAWPDYFPKGVLSPGDTTCAASSGPLVCSINYAFTGGGLNIGFSMTNAKGADNYSTCGPSFQCTITTTYDTATYRIIVNMHN